MRRFFFDRNVNVRVARMLSVYEGAEGHEVRHHNDDRRFDKTSGDEFILNALKSEDVSWIFVSGDGRILKNKAQVALLAELDLTFVCLANIWCNKPLIETAWMFVKGWPKVALYVDKLKEPSIVEWKYGGNGDVEFKGTTAGHRRKR